MESAEHLHDEIWMLQQTARRLLHDGVLHTDRALKNAAVESFTIHARGLTEFLYPQDEKRRRITDVIAHDFVADRTGWISARGAIPEALHDVLTPARRRRRPDS